MTDHISASINTGRFVRTRKLHDRWWGPVWRGLTVEENAKHYRAMGKAVWLYIYLIVHANRKTGELFRLIPSIAKDMALPERTIRDWLRKLRKGGYVTTQSTGRGLVISVLKWKPLRHNMSD